MRTALPILAQIAKEAGDKILEMRPDIILNKRWKIKPDGSPVTDADIEANRIVCEGLRKHFPHIPIVSEENSPKDNARSLQAKERFDTDPLDITTGYLKGYTGYSVNIGRIKDGVPVEGAIYFPARKEIYFTGSDGKAYFQQDDKTPKVIHVRKLRLRSPLEAAVGFHEQHVSHLVGHKHNITQYPGQLRTCMVARGECDITGINKGHDGGFNSWDTAGPHAVLLAAGGEIIGTDGKPMRYAPNTVKLPDHIAGTKEALVSLGLAGTELIQSTRKRA